MRERRGMKPCCSHITSCYPVCRRSATWSSQRCANLRISVSKLPKFYFEPCMGAAQTPAYSAENGGEEATPCELGAFVWPNQPIAFFSHQQRLFSGRMTLCERWSQESKFPSERRLIVELGMLEGRFLVQKCLNEHWMYCSPTVNQHWALSRCFVSIHIPVTKLKSILVIQARMLKARHQRARVLF